jgi:Tol biopolymer transport system component/DNA-binding winged helix-turn-helix (wHTH) protein
LNADNLMYEFGPFLFEPHARRLSRNGELVPLAAPEFELLLLLVRNRGRIVEKREIMDAVWPDAAVEENNLTVRMSSLRRALGETKGHHPYIQTVTGRGYCLTTQVKELFAQSSTGSPETVANTQGVPGSPVSSTGEPAFTGEPSTVDPVVARPSGRPLAAAGRRWEIRGFRLYALLVVGLLSALALYGVLRWQRNKSPAPGESMKMSRVTHTGRVAYAAVSPDGQNIAYVERDGDLFSLWLQRAGTNNPLQLLPPAKLLYKEPAFSRDGNTLYYSKCQPECQLNRMPVFGGVETALSTRADTPVTFSPDGKRMAYVRVDAVGGEIVVNLLTANPDGTGVEVLNSRDGRGNVYQYGTPAWSPDGKMIALPFLVREGGRTYMKVVGVGIADRAESTLTSGWRFIKDVAWLPGSDGLVINARDEASAPELAMQIWRVPLTGGKAQRITNDLNTYTRIGISGDGTSLMAVQSHWTTSLWIAPAENPSARTQVTRGTIDRRDGNLGLSITRDGGRLIYIGDLSGKRDLWSINTDGSDLRQLTDGPHKNGFPAVTPDGRYVVFESTRDGAHNIWRADADGRNATRLTRGSYDSEPTCSPDGKWVIYVSEEGRIPKLRKIPIGGGEPIPLTDEFAQHPTFSPDGKVIAYHRIDAQRRRDVVLIPAQGGAPIKTFPSPKNYGSVMRWAPAGDSLSYRDNTLTAIWRLPLDGAPPSPVMNLRGEQLYSFCYSQDGRRLAYASGPNLSDVIVIKGF